MIISILVPNSPAFMTRSKAGPLATFTSKWYNSELDSATGVERVAFFGGPAAVSAFFIHSFNRVDAKPA